jgi:hypothetical protein
MPGEQYLTACVVPTVKFGEVALKCGGVFHGIDLALS